MQVLFATDGSGSSEAAANLLQRMPLPRTSELTLLTVLPRLDQAMTKRESLSKSDTDHAEELLVRESARFDETGWKVRTMTREGHIAREIVEAANGLGANLLVVGAKGLSGLKRFLLGSVSQNVTRYAPCSVLVVRQHSRAARSGDAEAPLRVVLAYDDSEPAERAVKFLASLPRQERVEVLVVTVQILITALGLDLKQKQGALWHETQLKMTSDLNRVASELLPLTPHVVPRLLEAADAAEGILNVAGDFDADLIVLGATGRSGIERLLLGSVANRVLYHANCSVLVVRD